MYVYVWRYQVKPGSEAAFEAAYGPGGDWVRLFEGGDGYVDTLLLRDDKRPGCYLTIDRWRSQAAFGAFRAARADAWVALDLRCEALTVVEEEIGTYAASDGAG
jgi:heme-degrading monooxygenase HmoA